jgi:hemoglobin
MATGVPGLARGLPDPDGSTLSVPDDATPTLYEWAGGADAFERLTSAFYERVRADDLLSPVFAGMSDDHPHHVALWLGEVFGGPRLYTEEHGGYPHMLAKHRGLALTEEQRFRWVVLIAQAADDAALPADPEFRSAFLAYVEWGTRLAVTNSQPGAEPPPRAPVPRWGWGEAPPYLP